MICSPTASRNGTNKKHTALNLELTGDGVEQLLSPKPMAGPDLNPMVGDLPAKLRFEGKTVPRY
jgi:hypothetical protein